VFGSSGSGFTFNVNWAFYPSYSLTVSGAGIINNSGTTQTLVAAVDDFGDYGSISFTNSASAGTLTAFTISGAVADGVPGGSAEFFNNSTAANSTFTNTRCLLPYGYGGFTAFYDTSTAGNATLIAYASRGGDGAKIDIWGDATGGTSRVKVFGSPFGDYYSGNLDITLHNLPGVTIGSIEGSGTVHLGAKNLSVGSNNLSTTFSGSIDGIAGSFTKIGTGTLTLTGANTYTGVTTVEGGELVVDNNTGSGTGTGPVQVNAGILTGRGFITGAVTIGTGTGPNAALIPGKVDKNSGALTIQRALTLEPNAIYKFDLKTKTARANKVVANAVLISDANLSWSIGGLL